MGRCTDTGGRDRQMGRENNGYMRSEVLTAMMILRVLSTELSEEHAASIFSNEHTFSEEN